MYPAGELTLLLARKTALRGRIAVRRLTCAADAAEVARPLVMLDQAIATWRQLQPVTRLAAVPIGFWLTRSFGRRFRLRASLLRWGLLIGNAIRGFTGQPA
jgi:hypothetical protein